MTTRRMMVVAVREALQRARGLGGGRERREAGA